MRETTMRIGLAIVILAILAGLYLSATNSVWIWQKPKAQPVWDINDLALPSISDVQALLNRIEPEPRIAEDGRIGPKTIEKWNRLYCEVSAQQ
uniref:Uncharacterized protein n=2 Tax=viral metagenome TaxID=1070528 RepID=A0A6H1ZQ12_9ZZZZ